MPTGPAVVLGYVYEGSPVVFVGAPAEAPAGDVPVAGAQVRVLDAAGNVVGEADTGADGSYRIDNLPPGLLTVEVRKDPNTAVPDAVARVTAVPGASFVVGRVYPVSRAAAGAQALAGVAADALVVGTMTPLPAGAQVAPAAADGEPATLGTGLRVLAADTWLFMVDPLPEQPFGHPVEFRFVDAATGALETVPALMFPKVNGRSLWSHGALDWGDFGGVDPTAPSTLPSTPRGSPTRCKWPRVPRWCSCRPRSPPSPAPAPRTWRPWSRC